jgi:hypothetical protein
MVPETSVIFGQLTWLIAREFFFYLVAVKVSDLTYVYLHGCAPLQILNGWTDFVHILHSRVYLS